MKKSSIILLVLISILSADLAEGVKLCSQIDTNKARLDCFDSISKIIEDNTGRVGAWKVLETDSLMDDSTQVLISIAGKPIRDTYGFKTPTLNIRCKDNKTETFIYWGVFMGSGDKDLKMRLDKKKVSLLRWTGSSDGTSTFYPGSYNVLFIKKLMKHSKISVQAEPYNKSSVQTVFETIGLDEAIKPLRKSCGW